MKRTSRVAEVRAEHLLTELLTAQGWDVRRPPNGDLLRQQEYKDHPHLLDAFRGRAKHLGGGDALPEGVLIDRATMQPVAVIEAKASAADLAKAIREATGYAEACIDAGYQPLAVAVAGTSEDEFAVRVQKWDGQRWVDITYDSKPINWVPNRADTDRLRVASASAELRPSIPSPEVLAKRADEINRLLRESGVKDELRPGYVGAIMLALWQSKGNIRKDPEHILNDINEACKAAFWKAKKPDLAVSLRVDAANKTLRIKARRITAILERLNVSVLTAEHDYLGQLYETFFRYTGGNTIGQYFTPRHIADFMADLVEVGPDDVVLDPACGTGGFLIAAMNRILHERPMTRAQLVKLVQTNLLGFDKEPVTAALCVANMILRGDGSTGVRQDDALSAAKYPRGRATVVLMNPPFPHRKTDTPPEKFVDRAIDGLALGGRLAVIVPMSLLVKGDKQAWRRALLAKNTLDAVIALPEELFQPYAASTTAVVVLTKGRPHPRGRAVFFARVANDGFELHKGTRVAKDGSQLPVVLAAYRGHQTLLGLCGAAAVDDGEWAPGAYIQASQMDAREALQSADELLRIKTATIVKYARNFSAFADALAGEAVSPRDYHDLIEATPSVRTDNTIGGLFDVYYGQQELENKAWLSKGLSPVISSSGSDNGIYGFFSFDDVISAPFVTVPRTGSIGEAHVQEWPCGATSDCLLLIPRDGVTLPVLYAAAAAVRREAWRFNYGRKITPDRIASIPVPIDEALLAEISRRHALAADIERLALENAADYADADVASVRLAAIRDNPDLVIRGGALDKRLAELE